MKYKKYTALILSILLITLLVAGCAGTKPNSSRSVDPANDSSTEIVTAAVSYEGDAAYTDEADTAEDGVYASFTSYNAGILQGSEIFTTRDLRQDYDADSATVLPAESGKTIDITDAGVYVLSGSAENCTVRVNADDAAKIQLVLDGVEITNDSAPAIYLVNGDKLFITTTNSNNTLRVTGAFSADGNTNTDAVIFGKDDLVFGGLGTLTIVSADGHGISGKDDLKFTGGSYAITADGHGIEANDSIAICGGSFTLETAGDGLHAANDDDEAVGWIYIANTQLTISADDDCIHGETVIQIDSGTVNVTGHEGIEGTYIQINGGSITVNATDDCINAGAQSSEYSVVIEINGGDISVTVGQGDTDAIDSNGDIYVNGGTININTPNSAFDYDGYAEYNGGTIIINGEQVNSIPQAMMGGRGGW